VSEAVDYLLGEMEPDRVARFEAELERDAALRAEVERLRPVVTRLDALPAEAWASAPPPPLREPGVVTAPDAAPVPPLREPAAPRRRRLVLRPAVAALCAVALLAAGVGLGVVLDRDPEPATRLVLSPIEGVDPAASGRVGVTSDRVNLRVSGLPPTAEGQFYELWLLGADQQLVGLGSFRVGEDGMATLKLPLPVDPGQFRYFDISLEPGDGDPGHSGVSILRGPSV
jgi:anti-sigma-K factor RskA